MIENDKKTKKNIWAYDNPFFAFIVMLNSDMALVFNFTQESNYQASQLKPDDTNGIQPPPTTKYQTCSVKSKTVIPNNRVPGCMNPSSSSVIPLTYPLVTEYAKDNKKFVNAFAIAYDKMTSVGYSTYPDTTGKLGTLKYLTCDDNK